MDEVIVASGDATECIWQYYDCVGGSSQLVLAPLRPVPVPLAPNCRCWPSWVTTITHGHRAPRNAYRANQGRYKAQHPRPSTAFSDLS